MIDRAYGTRRRVYLYDPCANKIYSKSCNIDTERKKAFVAPFAQLSIAI